MSNVNGTTPVKNEEILQRFRQNIEYITTQSYSDEFLLRVLRAKNFDLRKSEKLFRLGYNIRRTYQLDTLAKTYKKSEVFERCEFATFLGFDKSGSPVIYVALGNADFDGFVKSHTLFDVCQYSTYNIESAFEKQRENNKKTGRQAENDLVAIFDFENFSIQQITNKQIIETGLDMMRMFQDTYPGIMSQIFVINAPTYFSVIFNIFKPILKFEIIEKLVICTKENSATELLKHIDADVLPVFLGGTRIDENGDPNCTTFIKYGCKVPEEEYGRFKKLLNVSDSGVSEMTIPARTYHELEFDVPEAESHLHLEVWSDNTIGLNFYYRNNNMTKINSEENNHRRSNVEEVSPYAKIQSQVVPLDNKVFCSRAGTYIARFDNRFSWMSSKYIVYRITVLPPAIKPPQINGINH